MYATATGTDELITLDETIGAELCRAPTVAYPDGIAYAATTGQLVGVERDPAAARPWSTLAPAGSSGRCTGRRGRQRRFRPRRRQGGGGSGAVLVDVQSKDQLLTIDPASRAVLRRTALPGCHHDQGLVVLPARRLAFVACDGNAALLVLDLTDNTVTQHLQVGRDPDVLAVDPDRAVLLVSAESAS